MYHSCFYGESQPPEYDDALTIPSTSNVSSGNTPLTEMSLHHLPCAHVSESGSDIIVADQATTSWKETILDNIHNLRNFTHSDNPYSKNINIGVHFTAEVGEVGVEPVHIDPLKFEYQQGDYVNGYVHLKNNHSEPIPFQMFYVLFEGMFTVVDSDPSNVPVKRTVKVKKFMEMYDFAASWNPVQMQVNRLLKELNKHYDIKNTWDPIDQSENSMQRNIIQPGVLYKRFFTFKIPENMLDTECNDHRLSTHTRLPPSFGYSAEELSSNCRKSREVSDLAFPNSSTSYGVLARFIGKALSYNVLDATNMKTKLIDSLGDEYVIISQKTGFIRVVLEDTLPSEAEKVINREATRLLYDNLVNRIKEKISKGKELQKYKAQGEEKFREYLATTEEHVHAEMLHESHKIHQLYTQLDNVTKNVNKLVKPRDYEIFVPVQKNNFLRGSKYQGMLVVKSPRHEYMIHYQGYSKAAPHINASKLRVPVSISYLPATNYKLAKIPEITHIDPELIAFTMSTSKHPIPIELHHDLLFKNKYSLTLNDNFKNIVQGSMCQYGKELDKIMRDVGADNLRLEHTLKQDIVALATSRHKENRIKFRESKLVDAARIIHSNELPVNLALTESAPGVYTHEFEVDMDVTKAQKYTGEVKQLPANYCFNSELCLVPSFQTCFLARIYYIRLVITFSTGDKAELKLPATIAKLAS